MSRWVRLGWSKRRACDPHAMPILLVKAKPNARASSLTQQDDGTWLAHLKSPPVDGKANAELIDLVAEQFGCRKAQVTIKTGGMTAADLSAAIKTGGGSRLKRVEIPD